MNIARSRTAACASRAASRTRPARSPSKARSTTITLTSEVARSAPSAALP
jgi:hypothetical protein